MSILKPVEAVFAAGDNPRFFTMLVEELCRFLDAGRREQVE